MSKANTQRIGRQNKAQRKITAGEVSTRIPTILTLSLVTIVVVLAIFCAHHRVFSAKALSFDDEEVILRNQLVQHPSMESVKRFFGEVFRSSVVRGYYRPLTLTSLMLDWEMGARPDNLRVFHRTSLALHVGSTVLLIMLCYQLFRRPWIAAAVGLLFGLHPITVEPIAWVMERKTLLAAFFAFAALNAYVRFAMVGTNKLYAVTLVMFLMSLLSKPTSTPLPLIMLLMSYWPLKRFSRRAVVEIIPFLVLSILFAALACICEQKTNPLTLPAKLSPLHLPLRLCWLTVFYPCKILLPIHMTSVYMLPDPLDLTNPMVIAAAAGAFMLIMAVIFSARRTPAIWVGTLIFYLGLAPTMGFVGYSWVSASDKYLYLPAVGLVLILAWLLDGITTGGNERTRRVRQVVTAVVVLAAAVLLGLGTHRYLQKWKDTGTLARYMFNLAPDSPQLNYTMGLVLYKENKLDEALAYYRKSLDLDANFSSSYYAMGVVLKAEGRVAEAITSYRRALELKPDDLKSMNNLAWELAVHEFDRSPGDIDPVALAEKACRQLGYREPTYLDTLAAAYANEGRYEEAIKTSQEAVQLAENAGNMALAGQIRQRIKLYQSGQPYREPQRVE